MEEYSSEIVKIEKYSQTLICGFSTPFDDKKKNYNVLVSFYLINRCLLFIIFEILTYD